MNEAEVRRQINRGLGLKGYWTDTQDDAMVCQNCHKKTLPPSGKPDVTVMSPKTPSFYMEVKVLRKKETSFPFNRIVEDQRKWLSEWEAIGGFSAFVLGVIRPHGSRAYLDHLYFMPWAEWLNLECMVSKYQDSVPFTSNRARATEIKEYKLDILTMLKRYELVRVDGEWDIPNHMLPGRGP